MTEQLITAVNNYKRAIDERKKAHLSYLSAKDELQRALADCGVSATLDEPKD